MMHSPEVAELAEHLTPFDPAEILHTHAQTFAELAASYDRSGGSHARILADEFRQACAQLRLVHALLADGRLDTDRANDWAIAAGTWRHRVENLIDGLELAHARGLTVTLGSLTGELRAIVLDADQLEPGRPYVLRTTGELTAHPAVPA